MTERVGVETYKAFKPRLRYRVRWRIQRDWGEWKLAFLLDWRHPIRSHRDVRKKMDDHRREIERKIFFGTDDGLSS